MSVSQLQSRRIVVVGGGIAGLATALHLAPLPVTLITAAPLLVSGATALAQGGIAAAIGPDDSPDLHMADTLAASAGLADACLAKRVADAAPASVETLFAWGVPFDPGSGGRPALGLEAAHSRRRILHARQDRSGAAILKALAQKALETGSIQILDKVAVADLAVEDGEIAGVVLRAGGETSMLPARGVVLASGGIGGLFEATTNPLSAIGAGLAMAARAGVALADLEFVQFHPTAIALGGDPMPLATEAIRGEGAALVDRHGTRIMDDVEGGDLAPRDVVARRIHEYAVAGKPVFLDGRDAIGDRFPKQFPGVTAFCRERGLDPATEPIPVRPAAHYHMGGVKVDGAGRTSLRGLWACGEVACTGLHGANRLASNSLLEAVVFARWIADDLRDGPDGPRPSRGAAASRESAPDSPDDARRGAEIRQSMTRHLGLVREARALWTAAQHFARLWETGLTGPRVADMALAAFLVAAAAHERCESRGAHMRGDYPETNPNLARRNVFTLDEALSRMGREQAASKRAVMA